MYRTLALGLFGLFLLVGCEAPRGTEPPTDGWANRAPTMVEQVVNRQGTQLLQVRQGELRTWVSVPDFGARVGDHLLLGQGTARRDVHVEELGRAVREVVKIPRVRIVDVETACRAVRHPVPTDAVRIGELYSRLSHMQGTEVIVHGTVVKAPGAIGWYWVHLQDGSGDASRGTHDLTVKTSEPVSVGQRVTFRGVLRQDVDLGFGYHYQALVEQGTVLHPAPGPG